MIRPVPDDLFGVGTAIPLTESVCMSKNPSGIQIIQSNVDLVNPFKPWAIDCRPQTASGDTVSSSQIDAHGVLEDQRYRSIPALGAS